jgi:hypothetical protein
MAILNVGDYVLVREEREGDKLGRITQLDFHPMYHLVWLMDSSMPMAILKHQQYITPIDPAFHKLLTDVNKESDDD